MSFIGSAIGGLIGGAVSGIGAYEGAKAQADAAKYAADLQYKQYQNNVNLLQPFISTGTSANNRYADLSGANGASAQAAALANLAQDPFMASIQNAANQQTLAAAGRYGAGISGNALNALYAQNANLYDNYLNQQIGYIGNAANRGLSAGTALAGQGMQAASNAGNFLSAAGAAQGAGIMGAGNALGNAINNAGLYYTLSTLGPSGGLGSVNTAGVDPINGAMGGSWITSVA